MRRMNGMDAYMIHTDQINAVQHTLKIAILDPATAPGGWHWESLRDGLRAMPRVLPWTRWKYVTAPLGLHHPLWVEDPDFDIDYHIRRVACPAPGNTRALCDLIADLYITPMDHRRPLWMVWVIEGLEGGKVANVMLLHHAYADGTGAAVMMQRCYKPKPFRFVNRPEAWNPPPVPTRSALLAYALREMPGIFWRTVPKVIQGVRQSRRLTKEYEARGKPIAPSPFKGVPDSPTNDLLSACRSFAFETLELARIRRVSKHFGVTINDLYVASAAWAYRCFMEDKGYDADAGPLIATIGFSRRPPPEQDDGLGNRTTVDYLSLPVNIAEPIARLNAAREAGTLMKEHYREATGADMNSVLDLMPAAAIRALTRSIARKRGKGGIMGNAAISNVPGPKDTLYLGQYKLDNWISTGQVVQGLTVNTTAWSYAGKFNFCVLADRQVMPDAWTMIGHFRDALESYERLAFPTRPQGADDGAGVPA
jgi:diacylglycerol O-acyltransferase